MDKSHFNVIYHGAPEGKTYEGFTELAKEKSYDFWHADGDCAKEYGVTAPGVSIVRTTGGASPFAWPGMQEEEKEKADKLDKDLTEESKQMAEHDVASSLEHWL
jgi:hypothetical protein